MDNDEFLKNEIFILFLKEKINSYCILIIGGSMNILFKENKEEFFSVKELNNLMKENKIKKFIKKIFHLK